MLRLKCFNCGLALPYESAELAYCPRCIGRDRRAVRLIAVSDRPSSLAPRSIGRLSIRAQEQDGRHTLALDGELDIASAPMLEAALGEVCAQRPKEVVLEMAGVEFVDSSGLNAILRGKALCEAHECDFSLAPAQRPVQRVFEVTRLLDRLAPRRSGGRGEAGEMGPAPQ